MAEELSQLLFSDDFDAYRLLELSEGTRFLKELFVKDYISPEYTKGAIAMLRTIVKLPNAMAKNQKQKDRAEEIVRRSFAQLEIKLMRRLVED